MIWISFINIVVSLVVAFGIGYTLGAVKSSKDKHNKNDKRGEKE